MAGKKVSSNTFRLMMLIFIGALFILPFILSFFISSSNDKALYQSKAASPGKTIIVSGLTGDAIKQAVDSAQNGDTIVFPPGNYQGPTAIPMGLGDSIAVSADRGGAATCFVLIDHKDLTLKGMGSGWTRATLYGEGHSRPYQDPYQTRGGLCIVNGSHVTVDGLRLKEFQKRCAVVYNSAVIVKNSIIDGCDEGGYSLLGNSAGLFVNNNFSEMNFGGVMLWQNSQAKIVNNIFYDAAVLYFYHPGTTDQAKAEIINNIFSEMKSDIAQVDWWKADPAQLKSNTLSYNIIWRSKDQTCNPATQLWCDNFPGKITADPMFTAPVTDPTGIAAWADFSLKAGSPASGVGDPSIPGSKTLGNAGGPCVEPDSSTCSNFIQSNTPQPYAEPTPTPPPQQDVQQQDVAQQGIGSNDQSTQPANNNQNGQTYVTNQVGPQPSPIYNNVFTQEQGVIYIENTGGNKTIKLKALYLQNANQNITGELSSGQSIKYSFFASLCNGTSLRASGALIYSSSEDNYQSIRYKNLDLDCYKTHIIDIQ